MSVFHKGRLFHNRMQVEHATTSVNAINYTFVSTELLVNNINYAHKTNYCSMLLSGNTIMY